MYVRLIKNHSIILYLSFLPWDSPTVSGTLTLLWWSLFCSADAPFLEKAKWESIFIRYKPSFGKLLWDEAGWWAHLESTSFASLYTESKDETCFKLLYVIILSSYVEGLIHNDSFTLVYFSNPEGLLMCGIIRLELPFQFYSLSILFTKYFILDPRWIVSTNTVLVGTQSPAGPTKTQATEL